uniref:Uncharacterized protein n=1 Tax=Rhodosorus marinus TaxID=101924 RepID=A0A7S2ZC75_9RHOD
MHFEIREEWGGVGNRHEPLSLIHSRRLGRRARSREDENIYAGLRPYAARCKSLERVFCNASARAENRLAEPRVHLEEDREGPMYPDPPQDHARPVEEQRYLRRRGSSTIKKGSPASLAGVDVIRENGTR